jgi:hypothetical protein
MSSCLLSSFPLPQTRGAVIHKLFTSPKISGLTPNCGSGTARRGTVPRASKSAYAAIRRAPRGLKHSISSDFAPLVGWIVPLIPSNESTSFRADSEAISGGLLSERRIGADAAVDGDGSPAAVRRQAVSRVFDLKKRELAPMGKACVISPSFSVSFLFSR